MQGTTPPRMRDDVQRRFSPLVLMPWPTVLLAEAASLVLIR